MHPLLRDAEPSRQVRHAGPSRMRGTDLRIAFTFEAGYGSLRKRKATICVNTRFVACSRVYKVYY